MPGASQPSSGFASEGRPAVTRKLCKSRSGSNDFRKTRFKLSRDFTHESVNITSLFAKGRNFSTGEGGTIFPSPAIAGISPYNMTRNDTRHFLIVFIVQATISWLFRPVEESPNGRRLSSGIPLPLAKVIIFCRIALKNITDSIINLTEKMMRLCCTTCRVRTQRN